MPTQGRIEHENHSFRADLQPDPAGPFHLGHSIEPGRRRMTRLHTLPMVVVLGLQGDSTTAAPAVPAFDAALLEPPEKTQMTAQHSALNIHYCIDAA